MMSSNLYKTLPPIFAYGMPMFRHLQVRQRVITQLIIAGLVPPTRNIPG